MAYGVFQIWLLCEPDGFLLCRSWSVPGGRVLYVSWTHYSCRVARYSAAFADAVLVPWGIAGAGLGFWMGWSEGSKRYLANGTKLVR